MSGGDHLAVYETTVPRIFLILQDDSAALECAAFLGALAAPDTAYRRESSRAKPAQNCT
jgi:hypothetical protein